MISYDAKRNIMPYFKVEINSANEFIYDTNLVIINENADNIDNNKLFFLVNNTTYFSYKYYNNEWKFITKLSDFNISPITSVRVILRLDTDIINKYLIVLDQWKLSPILCEIH